jgi:hypothetical protein
MYAIGSIASNIRVSMTPAAAFAKGLSDEWLPLLTGKPKLM